MVDFLSSEKSIEEKGILSILLHSKKHTWLIISKKIHKNLMKYM